VRRTWVGRTRMRFGDPRVPMRLIRSREPKHPVKPRPSGGNPWSPGGVGTAEPSSGYTGGIGWSGQFGGWTWGDGDPEPPSNDYSLGFTYSAVDSYLEIPDAPELNPTTKMSVSLWARMDPWEYRKAMVSKTGATSNKQWWLQTRKNVSYPRDLSVVFFNPDLGFSGRTVGVYTSNDCLVDGEWNHIAVTFDAGEVHIWVNGADQPTAISLPGDPLPTSIPVGPEPLMIGGGDSAFNDGFGPVAVVEGAVPGYIDEVSLWDSALTASEIGEIAGEPVDLSVLSFAEHLIGWWRMENNGNDETANANHGTRLGDQTFWATVTP